jgi:DNA-binding CsgD family transcriptional regulator
MMPTPEVAVASARRVGRSILVVRWVMASLALAMTGLFEPVHLALPVLVVLGLVAFNLHDHRTLAAIKTLEAARRQARWSVTVDVLAAGTIYLAFLRDPSAMPVALLALLVFELSLRFGGAGIAVGSATFLTGIGMRVYVQRVVLEEGAVRPELLVLWAALAVLLIAFSREFWSQEHRRTAALDERQRLAEDLRATVLTTLERSGIKPGAATHDQVLDAVEAILAARGTERAQLVDRVATLLAAPHQGLTPRELEILLLLGQGHPDARIAATLFITPSTVRNHVQNMRKKLGYGSREELREYAKRYAPPT